MDVIKGVAYIEMMKSTIIVLQGISFQVISFLVSYTNSEEVVAAFNFTVLFSMEVCNFGSYSRNRSVVAVVAMDDLVLLDYIDHFYIAVNHSFDSVNSTTSSYFMGNLVDMGPGQDCFDWEDLLDSIINHCTSFDVVDTSHYSCLEGCFSFLNNRMITSLGTNSSENQKEEGNMVSIEGAGKLGQDQQWLLDQWEDLGQDLLLEFYQELDLGYKGDTLSLVLDLFKLEGPIWWDQEYSYHEGCCYTVGNWAGCNSCSLDLLRIDLGVHQVSATYFSWALGQDSKVHNFEVDINYYNHSFNWGDHTITGISLGDPNCCYSDSILDYETDEDSSINCSCCLYFSSTIVNLDYTVVASRTIDLMEVVADIIAMGASCYFKGESISIILLMVQTYKTEKHFCYSCRYSKTKHFHFSLHSQLSCHHQAENAIVLLSAILELRLYNQSISLESDEILCYS